jgi:DNA-binding transcriptional LysR family regulator
MARRLPSLNALKAFEAAARHESFTKAAEELCVTQGAVSHQVKALEEELGFRLFQRERQRLVITEAGRSYLEVVRDAFDRLAAGTERLLQRQKAGVLTVSTSPNFAAKWLVHRLGGFAELHPEIDLRVSASMQHVDFARDDVDLTIRQWWKSTQPAMHPSFASYEVPQTERRDLPGSFASFDRPRSETRSISPRGLATHVRRSSGKIPSHPPGVTRVARAHDGFIGAVAPIELFASLM